jgi:hypothetical protein
MASRLPTHPHTCRISGPTGGNGRSRAISSTEGAAPSVFVSCEADGAKVAGTAVAFAEANGWPKPVKDAWRIDDNELAFKKVEGAKIVCEP